MKKTFLLSLVVSLASAASVMAQGVVNFSNSTSFSTAAGTASNGHTDRLVYNTDNVSLLGGTNYLAQIYWASGGGVAEGSISTPVDNTAIQFLPTLVGKWVPAGKTFTGATAGSTVTLQVRVWDGTLSTGYQDAIDNNKIHGASKTFNYTVAASTDLPAAKVMEGLQSFTMVTPEPTTIALGVLGAAGLLIVRRRK